MTISSASLADRTALLTRGHQGIIVASLKGSLGDLAP